MWTFFGSLLDFFWCDTHRESSHQDAHSGELQLNYIHPCESCKRKRKIQLRLVYSKAQFHSTGYKVCVVSFLEKEPKIANIFNVAQCVE